ncbi:MAG: hypothetical protein QF903_09855 [Planctomycetota bacterium]|nr:hypothetical protein [Planctomycetota bacterium]MDP6989769.1 hypothetical protein [Planctomycetota bacterium]
MTAVATGLLLLVAAMRGELQDPVQLVGQGRYAQALAAARAGGDSLERWQNELHVLHSGGDLQGALAAAEEGLSKHPFDPWLGERATFIALSLRRTSEARAFLGVLAQAVADLPSQGRSSWTPTLERLEVQVRGQEGDQRLRERALARARGTVIAVSAAILTLISWMAARGRPRPSTRKEAARPLS